MIKSKELTDPNSCMSKARDDEMTFVLLGRDAAAPLTIRTWVQERIRLGKNTLGDPQIQEALACADTMDKAAGRAPAPAAPLGAGEALRQIETYLTNLQPHIPQACFPGHAAFIDNYVDPCLKIARAALSSVPVAPDACVPRDRAIFAATEAIREVIQKYPDAGTPEYAAAAYDAIKSLGGAVPVAPDAPLTGQWRYSNGVLCCGTLRVMRDDWDTNPAPEFRAQVMEWACRTLNAGAVPVADKPGANLTLSQAVAAADAEPEFPGEPPPEMVEALRNCDQDVAVHALRLAVRMTKDGIKERLRAAIPVDPAPKSPAAYDQDGDPHPELLRRLTVAAWEADKGHLRTGGGTRHWMRDQFLPICRRLGVVITAPAEILADTGDLTKSLATQGPAPQAAPDPHELVCRTCNVRGLYLGDFTAQGDHAGHDIGVPEGCTVFTPAAPSPGAGG